MKLAELGIGELIGYSGAILGEKQFTSVTALERTTTYRLSLNELQASAGGEETPITMVQYQEVQLQLHGLTDAHVFYH